MPGEAYRRKRERGSALLIVFVFAAIVAIMLYREMPVSLFEAQRQKEQRLVDRGNEYVRGVQLFYRRNRGQYPSSIEQLENTNNIRYLRRRYKDPFTGKDDWRLLHAGPGGMLMDSKVQQTQIPGANGQSGVNGTGGTGQNSPTGQNSFGSSFGSSTGASTSSSSSSDSMVVVAPLPQRAPAIAANAVPGTGTQMPSSQTLDQNPDAPLLPPSASDTAQAGTGGALPSNSGNGNGQPNGGPGIMQRLNPVIGSGTPPPAQSGFGTSQGSSGSTMGQMSGGGALAGVASKATGRTIKVVNQQDDYALWEFYYNPATDPTGRLTLGGGVPSAPVQTGAPGMSAPVNSNGNASSNAAATDSGSATPDNSSPSSGASPAPGSGGSTSTAPPPSAVVPTPAPPQ